jgi:hypothetical protein
MRSLERSFSGGLELQRGRTRDSVTEYCWEEITDETAGTKVDSGCKSMMNFARSGVVDFEK